MARRALTGALLVGGGSERFGSPKALATLDGETLAERGWRVLGELCDERIAVGKIEDGLVLPFPIVDDRTDVRAPISGVVAALRAAQHDICVVLPVDCPLVTSELLGSLIDGLAVAADAAAPQTGPLPGAYRKTALPILERRLTDRELTLRDALEELRTEILECDAGLLVNVNTLGELERLSLE